MRLSEPHLFPELRSRMGFAPKSGGSIAVIPCEICDAPDSRSADHARGCPRQTPLSKPELRALASEIEDAWHAKAST